MHRIVVTTPRNLARTPKRISNFVIHPCCYDGGGFPLHKNKRSILQVQPKRPSNLPHFFRHGRVASGVSMEKDLCGDG